jgi:hypothetical protein
VPKKQFTDSTGLARNHELGDASKIYPSLGGTVPLAPVFAQTLSKAPGGLQYASLSQPLLEAANIQKEPALVAQQFVRDYGHNVVGASGRCLLIAGGNQPMLRRLLAAGAMNEIIRVYHMRVEVSTQWLQPRVFETMNTAWDRDRINTLFNLYTSAKILVFDNLNVAMNDHPKAVEELLLARISRHLPSILVMNESPNFSADLAEELNATHHYRAIFNAVR